MAGDEGKSVREARGEYVLGYSDGELARLEQQASLFAELTRDLLVRAGLTEGMKVLDVGCGVGDVSMIAAELIGPSGSILGIDPSEEGLAIAEARMQALGRTQARFSAQTLQDLDDGQAFDAVIGRFILIHFPDPAAELRDLVAKLRPGTKIAFIEFDLSTAAAIPPLPLLGQAVEWVREVYRRTGRQMDMGSHQFATFRAAGLEPELIGLTRIADGNEEAGFHFLAESVRSLAPAMEQLGIVSVEEIGLETLRDRLAEEAAAESCCIFYPRLIGAWATVA